MKHITLALLLIICNVSTAKNKEQSTVNFNETYELANIILALTEYGRIDRNEINKQTKYYQDVIAYFAPVSNHPILDRANYSREKWDKLLSFRTDAVAFAFNKKQQLKRIHQFYSMSKEINEFESNIDFIQDFVEKSNFREFYILKKPYFDSLALLYEQSLMINEVVLFLENEFDVKSRSKQRIIVSPLVGRMHCQRHFNKLSTSFINIPEHIYNVENINQIIKEKLASGVHMFFTEIDHDFVNPVTNKFKKMYLQNFDQCKWDRESGYGEWEMGVFNEYMTWAVYDVFIYTNFPDVSDTLTKQWHEVNASRGFFVSEMFGGKLLELYKEKGGNIKIIDLYPDMLKWCKQVENNLDKLKNTQ